MLIGQFSEGFLTALVLMVFSMGAIHAKVPTFPGAEGFGAKAKGGRGRTDTRDGGHHLQEHIWLHPQFHRRDGKDEDGDGIRDGDGEKQNFDFMTESEIDFYGMRYELPWSLFERTQGNYYFRELDRIMKRANGDNKTGKKFKVYIVLHDKTWYDQNVVNDNWPVPGDKKGDTSQYFVKKTAKNGRKVDIRVARRWDSDIQSGYLGAIEALAKRRTENSDYEQLEVISLGETSLAYGSMDILAGYGYPGAKWYRDYLIDIHQRAADIAIHYQTSRSPLKVAINLNWIPGQPIPKPNEKWFQHDVLSAVKETSNGVQAIEDVHANSQSKFYKTRVYDYTSDEQRVLPKERVWAHISCDTKRNGQSAADNLAMARSLASNIVLRHRCDGKGSTFQEYVALLTAAEEQPTSSEITDFTQNRNAALTLQDYIGASVTGVAEAGLDLVSSYIRLSPGINR